MDLPSTKEPNCEAQNEEAEKQLYKRMFLALKDELNVKHDSDNGLKSKRKLNTTSVTKMGRGIRRLVHLYCTIPDLILQADRYELHLSEDHDEFDGIDEDAAADLTRDWKRSYLAVKELARLVPNFYKKIGQGDPEELDEFYKQARDLQKGANDARSDDVKRLKEAVANWLNSWSPTPKPLLLVDCRLQRGIQHDTTGYLLCPVDYNWNDETVRAKLRAAEEGFDIGSSFFCRYLYRGYNADMKDLERGFLKSNLLVKAFKFIFTSPNSCKAISTQDQENSDNDNQVSINKRQKTLKGKRATRKDVASTLHMDGKVTPRSIAYVAVQLHFALSSAPYWSEVHEGFNYPDFYHFIIDFFEVTEGPDSQQRAQQLLQWWSRQIFPNSASQQSQFSSTSASKMAFRAQRKAREPETA